MTLLKIAVFSLVVIAFFTAFGNSLPQFKTEPPKVIEMKDGEVTIDEMISIGKERFETVCKLCHNPALAGRAPDPSDLVRKAEKRINDPNYKSSTANGSGGSATTVEAYLRESMQCPSCFVVPGFGTKGTNDMKSPMPVINKPPTAFTDFEMDSVIAYMQNKDGVDVTITPPAGKAEASEKEEASVIARSPEELLERLGCVMCHAVGSLAPSAAIGPDLKDVGRRKGEAYIRESILEPNAVVAEGFQPIMPANFADKMTVGEFEMLIKFLVNSKGEGAIQ